MLNYIVKTKVGSEARVQEEITARLEGSGSMQDNKKYIGTIINPAHLKGYLFVESKESHYLEAVLGLIRPSNIPRIKGVKEIVGEVAQEEIDNHAATRKATEGLEIGMIVTIKTGVWKGQEARVLKINEIQETLTVELWGSHVPIPVNDLPADSVRKNE